MPAALRAIHLRELRELHLALFSLGGSEIFLSTLLKIVAVVIVVVRAAQAIRARRERLRRHDIRNA